MYLHIFFLFASTGVPNVVSLSGLSIIMDCPSGFLSRLFNVQKQPVNLSLMFCYYSYILGPLMNVIL